MDSKTFFSLTIKYFQDKELAGQLLPVARKFLSDPALLTNEWNYKNTYTMDDGLAIQPEFKNFTNLILEKSRDYLSEQNIKLKPKYDLWVSMFASEMLMGDEHAAHNHPGALLSGIFYLNVPLGSSNIEFQNPRHSSPAWRNFLDEFSYENKDSFVKVRPDHTIVIKPEPGLFLLWESWATHRVPPNQSIEGRTTLVFNVGVDHID